jgi:hypothetical protein
MGKRILLTAVATLLAAACTVEQTEEGEAPQIDPGEAPSYDVQPADAELGWDTAVVRVPDIDINADTTPQQDTIDPRR